MGWIGVLGVSMIFWAANMGAQPEFILMDEREVFTERQRPAVPFPHISHMEFGLGCLECHHRFRDGENVLEDWELMEGEEGIKCASCHKAEPGFRLEADLDPTEKTLMQASHKMCLGCHRDRMKKDEPAGPVTCGECHPRDKEQD